jgi:hypothetical protein
MLLRTEIPTFFYAMQLRTAHPSLTKTTFCAYITSVCLVIWFSARNGGVTVSGNDDIIRENALYRPPKNTNLNPAELVSGDMKIE